MAIVVEDGTGLPNANSYGSVAGFRTYATSTGFPQDQYPIDSVIEVALVKATQYMEAGWGPYFLGCPQVEDQALSWPRFPVWDPRGRRYYDADEIPTRLQQACFEYAQVFLTSGTLTLTPSIDTTGQVVTKITEKVGPIEESRSFLPGSAQPYPSYPYPDSLMSEFVEPTGDGSVYR